MKTQSQTKPTNFLGTVLRCAMFLMPDAHRRAFGRARALLALLPLLSLTALGAQQGDFYYQANGSGAVLTAYVGPGGAVVIPDQLGGLPVKSIGQWGNYAFERRTNLTSVTLPNSVTNVGPYAFSECIGLTNLALPNSLTHIDQGAFTGCRGLKSVTIPPTA